VAPAEGSAHLEWILGPRRNVLHDRAKFQTELAELVVLWLEDLAVELNAASATPAAGARRRLAAQSLQAATRDFAAAFLGTGGGPENP
jgi:hypothetical protein